MKKLTTIEKLKNLLAGKRQTFGKGWAQLLWAAMSVSGKGFRLHSTRSPGPVRPTGTKISRMARDSRIGKSH